MQQPDLFFDRSRLFEHLCDVTLVPQRTGELGIWGSDPSMWCSRPDVLSDDDDERRAQIEAIVSAVHAAGEHA